MFNKPAKRAAESLGVASLLTGSMTVVGDISGEGELQVDCVIRGDVRVARLSVGEAGRIEGAVTADSLDLRGQVIGTVSARAVHVHASGRLIGDVTHEQLTMEAGADFQGRSIRASAAETAAPLAITAG